MYHLEKKNYSRAFCEKSRKKYRRSTNKQTNSNSQLLFEFVSYFLARYKNENNKQMFRRVGCNNFLLWKSSECHIFWVWVCSFSYPAYNAHGPYCHMWSVRLHHIFFLILSHKRKDFKNKLLTMKCVTWFSL